MKYLKYLFILLSLNAYAQRRAMPVTPLILADTLGAKSGDMVVHEDSSKFLLPVWIGGGLVYDVRVYGAKSDGTTNDAAAVQVAIDSANATGGGIVFFPEGTTLVGSTLIWYSNVSAMGVGHGSILEQSANDTLIRVIGTESSSDTSSIAATADSAQTDMDVIDGSTFSADDIVIIVLDDTITVDINGYDSLDTHIEWNRVASVSSNTITFVHDLRNTFETGDGGYVAILTPKKGIRFSNMTFQGNESGDGINIDYGEDILVENCKFIDIARNRIRWSKGVKFKECYFEDVHTCMLVDHSERCSFENNRTFNVTQNATVQNHSDFFNMSECHTRNSVYGIFNNYFNDYGNISHNFFETTSSYGILLDNGTKYTRVIGNYLHRNGSTAIALTGPLVNTKHYSKTFFIVKGNTVKDAVLRTLTIEGCSSNIVQGNIFIHCGTNTTHHAVLLQTVGAGYCDDNLIDNNLFYGVTGEGITFAGTSGTFEGNSITNNRMVSGYIGINTHPDFNNTTFKNNTFDAMSDDAYRQNDTTAVSDFTVLSDTFDLSGAAATEVVFVPQQDCYIISWSLIYEEASSADAGITLEIGTNVDPNRFGSVTSEISESAYYVKRYAGTTDDNACVQGTNIIVKSAGGKVGTGTVRFMLNITNIGN